MADDLPLIDPRPPPPRYVTKPRTRPIIACGECGAAVVVRKRNITRFCSRKCAGAACRRPGFIEWVRDCWDLGWSVDDIAEAATERLGQKVSRNVIAGISHRNNFADRPVPANFYAAKKAREAIHG